MMGYHAVVLYIFVILCWNSVVNCECYVRVNQLGFTPSSMHKTAVVLCAEGIATTTGYQVVTASSGASVLKGTVGTKTSLTAWSATYANAYTIDFSLLTTPGTYYILLQTTTQVKSYKFKIASVSDLYTPVLQHSLFFYGAQRDGVSQNANILNRKPSHLTDDMATVYKTPTYKNDEIVGNLTKVSTATVNVSGGWFDAGDYIKFVETTSYVVAVQLMAVRDHPELFKNKGNVDFNSEALFGLEWLAKMWDDKKKVLYYQVGIGDGNSKIVADHDLWRLPEADDKLNVKPGDKEYYIKYRPVFAVGDGTEGALISPNLAGRVAAAFALGYQTYKNTESVFASQLLSYAENVWALKQTTPSKLITTAPFDYYPETEWRDDLTLGGTELYFATKAAREAGVETLKQAEDYLTEASTYAQQYISKADTDTINLYDTAGLAFYELWKALGSGDEKIYISGLTRDDLVNSIKKQLNIGLGLYKKDIFGFSDKYDNGDDLTPHGFGYALQASLLLEMDPSSASTYDGFGQAQISWMFGNNAWGTSFMIGVGESFAFCPQHQIANLAGSLNGTAPNILFGAVYDGPSQSDNFSGLDGTPDGAKKCPPTGVDNFKKFTGQGVRYLDDVSAWPSVEPAIDYSVLPVLLLARYIGA